MVELEPETQCNSWSYAASSTSESELFPDINYCAKTFVVQNLHVQNPMLHHI